MEIFLFRLAPSLSTIKYPTLCILLLWSVLLVRSKIPNPCLNSKPTLKLQLHCDLINIVYNECNFSLNKIAWTRIVANILPQHIYRYGLKVGLNEDFKLLIANYKKRLLPRCIHHFKSDLINNMDHMRISGTEPSSVILSQRKQFKKLKSDAQIVPKQAKAKRDGVINPQNYNLNQFERRKF